MARIYEMLGRIEAKLDASIEEQDRERKARQELEKVVKENVALTQKHETHLGWVKALGVLALGALTRLHIIKG